MANARYRRNIWVLADYNTRKHNVNVYAPEFDRIEGGKMLIGYVTGSVTTRHLLKLILRVPPETYIKVVPSPEKRTRRT